MMKSLRPLILVPKGFTLLEIIITLMVASFLGAMLVQFMGTTLTRSGETVISVQNSFELSGVMEKIAADYERDYKSETISFDTFIANIVNGNNSGNDPYYGEYTVETGYITFAAGNEVEDTTPDKRVLKIVLAQGEHWLTGLFTKQP
jgi:prepilin-type N-terminal cleavage/methylation domain-containing protein